MKIDVLTLFPDMFTGVFGHSILKRAARNEGCFLIKSSIFVIMLIINIRTVDDYPYGGGAGMVLKPQPIFDAVRILKAKSTVGEPTSYSSLPSRGAI